MKLTFVGDLLAIISALSSALATCLYKILTNKLDVISINVLKNFLALFSFAFFFIFFPTELQQIFLITRHEWALIFYSSFLGIIIGDLAMLYALEKLGGGMNALMDCLYPPIMIFLAYILYQEIPSLSALIAFPVMLGGIFIVGLDEFKEELKTINNQTKKMKFFSLSFFIPFSIGILGIFSMCLATVLLKEQTHKYSMTLIVFLRFLMASFIMQLMNSLFFKKKTWKSFWQLNKKNKNLVFLASFFGPFMATVTWFYSFRYTSTANASVLFQTYTFFMIALAALFLKEPFTKKRLLASILGIAAAILTQVKFYE